MLGTDCQPAPGLYVAGEAAGGVHLDCVVYGRQAGLDWLNLNFFVPASWRGVRWEGCRF